LPRPAICISTTGRPSVPPSPESRSRPSCMKRRVWVLSPSAKERCSDRHRRAGAS